MKLFLMTAVAIAAISLSACNSNTNQPAQTSRTGDSAQTQTQTQATATNAKTNSITNEVIPAYLQIKNGLANDNGQEAATGGKALMDALSKIDNTSLSADQKKSYQDIADDAKQMAEHIATNADKIEHQREHFEMLSNDVYDLVKTFGATQTLYKEFCPMYNNNKGGAWISDSKEIKNPYLGKKMTTCGSVKEEIKQQL